MFPIVSGVSMGQGAAALSITLNKENFDSLDLIAPGGAHPLDSAQGQIDVTASAAGGDTSGDGYAYAWTVVEIGDDDDTAAGVLRILAAGEQGTAQYNELTLQGDSSSTAGQPFNVVYRLTCTVTDDAGTEADISIDQPVTVLAL